MATASQVQKNLQAAMRDALRIQDRFVADAPRGEVGFHAIMPDRAATA